MPKRPRKAPKNAVSEEPNSSTPPDPIQSETRPPFSPALAALETPDGSIPPERPLSFQKPGRPSDAEPTCQKRTYEDWYADTLLGAWRTGHYGSIEDLALAFGIST